jgi:hypothetical protein
VIGVFLVGCFITAIVATACGLVIYGIRADRRDLAERSSRAGTNLGTNLSEGERHSEQGAVPEDRLDSP